MCIKYIVIWMSRCLQYLEHIFCRVECGYGEDEKIAGSIIYSEFSLEIFHMLLNFQVQLVVLVILEITFSA